MFEDTDTLGNIQNETGQEYKERNPADYFNQAEIHLKSHGSDGVSLELQKLTAALSDTDIPFHGKHRMKTHILSGDFPEEKHNNTGKRIPLLLYDNKHSNDEIYRQWNHDPK